MSNQKRWLLALVSLVLIGGAVTAYRQVPRIRLQGTYYRTGEPTPGLQQIELTRDRFIMHLPNAGALASEYAIWKTAEFTWAASRVSSTSPLMGWELLAIKEI